ncbi:hypothetical protein [Paenibacillus alkalitolerans]|uniref:hypothetical protein n=1 Tax=Paenibacillus alkalitolerans TaxID=2799335 RepID=UPI0018F56F20|nr:hypothetical protein [Paenibacillus alkalitolerans]
MKELFLLRRRTQDSGTVYAVERSEGSFCEMEKELGIAGRVAYDVEKCGAERSDVKW